MNPQKIWRSLDAASHCLVSGFGLGVERLELMTRLDDTCLLSSDPIRLVRMVNEMASYLATIASRS